MTTAGRLVFQFMGDKSQLDATVKGARSGIGGLVNYAKGVLPGLLAAFGAVKSIDAADVQIQAEKKLAATLRATGNAAGMSADEIKKYATERQKLTNFSDEQTIDAAGILATFKQIRGEVFKETLGLAQDMSSVMGSDLKGSIVQLGKALNDPIRGMSALSDAGVTFNEVQREQIRLLQESGDLLGAQEVILSELRGEFKDTAEEMASPWQQLKNNASSIGQSFGRLFNPPLEVAAKLLGEVATYADQAVDEFEKLVGLADKLDEGVIWAGLAGAMAQGVKPILEDAERFRVVEIEEVTKAITKLNREMDLAQGQSPLAHMIEDFRELEAQDWQLEELIRKFETLEDIKLNNSLDDAITDARQNLKLMTGELTDIDVALSEFKGADPDRLAELRQILEEQKSFEEMSQEREEEQEQFDPLEGPAQALLVGTQEAQAAIARAISRNTRDSQEKNYEQRIAAGVEENGRTLSRMERLWRDQPQVLVAPEGT